MTRITAKTGPAWPYQLSLAAQIAQVAEIEKTPTPGPVYLRIVFVPPQPMVINTTGEEVSP